jgi:hypothetical protein
MSEVLQDAKECYLQAQKMLYAVLMASRKLRHNFHAHQVTVVTSYPLGHILRNREGMGHTMKWAIKLTMFGLQFPLRHAIKSQSLADFVTEWSPILDIKRPKETAYLAVDDDRPWTLEYWCMNFDGLLTIQGDGAGVVLTSSDGQILKYTIRLDFRATNNMAEYEGILARLRAVVGLGVCHLLVKEDSQLVVNHVSKEYQFADPQMATYMAEVRHMEQHFDGLEL